MFVRVFLLVSAIVFVVHTDSTEPSSEKTCTFYKCDDTDDQVFKWGESSFKCPKDKLCNKTNKPVSDDPSDPQSPKACHPCTEAKLACDGIPDFTCKEGNNFVLDGMELACPAKFICNKNREHGCSPCYQDKCPEDAWTCTGETTFVTTSIEGTCINGARCRIDKIGPCDKPCTESIAKLGRSTLPSMQITKLL